MADINFKQQERKILMDLIRHDNNDKPLELEWLTFKLPIAIESTVDIPRNTQVTVKSTLDSRYAGLRTFYYNRVDVNDFLFDGLVSEEDLTLPLTNQTTTSMLSELLSNVLAVKITPEMIVSEDLPIVIDDPVGIVITFNPDNYAIIGTLAVTLKR